jgi:hypothetical protein
LTLLIATCGCAEMHRPLLGTRVHRFTVKDTTLVHCSILMDVNQQQLAHDAIEVCRDEISEPGSKMPKK